jgi:hypothetical protein
VVDVLPVRMTVSNGAKVPIGHPMSLGAGGSSDVGDGLDAGCAGRRGVVPASALGAVPRSLGADHPGTR